MQPYNPYAPLIQTVPLAYRPAQGTFIKWLYLPVAIGVFLSQLGVTLAADPIARGLSGIVFLVLFFACLALACAWLGAAWRGIPRDAREGVTPTSAVLKLFIPFYNLYWMFAVNTLLCGILDDQLARIGSERRTPMALAIAGCIANVATNICRVPGLEVAGAGVLLITNAIWFSYMFGCDEARRILAENTLEE